MNEDFELDFDDEPENGKNMYNKRREHREYEKGNPYNKETIRNLSKSTSSKNLLSSDNFQFSNGIDDANINIFTKKYNDKIKNNEKCENIDNIKKIDSKCMNPKYYFIFFNNDNYSQVKDFISERSLKIFKPNHVIFNIKDLENSKHVYFMFLNSDKKFIKAVMKKDYLKYDREYNNVDIIKLETKTKQEIDFKELVKDYKFSDENFGRISLESSELGIEISSTNDFDIGNGLVMREVKDDEGIQLFEKIRKAMYKKEQNENKKLKEKKSRNEKSPSESSSENSESRSSSLKSRRVKDEKKKKKRKSSTLSNSNIAPQMMQANPYLMNYYYQFPAHYYAQIQKAGIQTPTEQINYYGYPPYKNNDIHDKLNSNSNLSNRNNVFPSPHMNPQMMAIFQQMHYHQNAAMYGVPSSIPGSLPRKDSRTKKKKIEKRSSSSSSSSSESKSRSHYLKKKKRDKSNSISRKKLSNNLCRIEENKDKIFDKKNYNFSKYDKNFQHDKFNTNYYIQAKYPSQMVKYSPNKNKTTNITSNSNSKERKKYFDLKLVNSYTELSRSNSRNCSNQVILNDENSIQFEKKEIKQRRLSSSSSQFTQELLTESNYLDINAPTQEVSQKRSTLCSIQDLHLDENSSHEIEYFNLKAEKEDYVKNLSLEINHKSFDLDSNITSRKRKRDQGFYNKWQYDKLGSKSSSKSKSNSILKSRYDDSYIEKRHSSRYESLDNRNIYYRDFNTLGSSTNFSEKEKIYKEVIKDYSFHRTSYKDYDRNNFRAIDLDKEKEKDYSIHRYKDENSESKNYNSRYKDNYYKKQGKYRNSLTSYSNSKYNKGYQGNRYINNYSTKNYLADKSKSKYSEEKFIESASFQLKKEEIGEREIRQIENIPHIPEVKQEKLNEIKSNILDDNRVFIECSNLEIGDRFSPSNRRKINSNFSDAPPEIENKSILYPKRKTNFIKDQLPNIKYNNDQVIIKENTCHENSSSLSNINQSFYSNDKIPETNEEGEIQFQTRHNFKGKYFSGFIHSNRRVCNNRGKLKIINESGKKKIILNKDRKNHDVKLIKKDK